jgi:hypothetical protein
MTTDEQLATVFLGLYLLWLFAEAYAALKDRDRGVDRPNWQRDRMTLEEEALARLETGGDVTVYRWHGDELTLVADEPRVIDTDGAVVDDDEEEESVAADGPLDGTMRLVFPEGQEARDVVDEE